MRTRTVYTISREMDASIEECKAEFLKEKAYLKDTGEMAYDVGADDKVSIAFQVRKGGKWVDA